MFVKGKNKNYERKKNRGKIIIRIYTCTCC